MWSLGISSLRTLHTTSTLSTYHPQSWCFASHKNVLRIKCVIIQTLLSISFFAYLPSFSLFLHLFMIAAFHGNFNDIDGARENKLYLLFSRYLFTTKVYLVVPISRKTDKVFKLELFVCYSWIVFLVNAHTSGIHDATRFLESTLEFMRDVSFRYLRIILSILLINFMIYSPE